MSGKLRRTLRPRRRPIKDHALEARQFSNRAMTAFVIIAAALLLLVSRFVYLQVVAHEEFATRSASNQVRVVPVPPMSRVMFSGFPSSSTAL